MSGLVGWFADFLASIVRQVKPLQCFIVDARSVMRLVVE